MDKIIFYTIPLLLLSMTLLHSILTLIARLKVEKELINLLAKEIQSNDKIQLDNLKTALNAKQLSTIYNTNFDKTDSTMKELQIEVDNAINLAISNILETERQVIETSLEQSVYNGRSFYKDKILHDSLNKIYKEQKV